MTPHIKAKKGEIAKKEIPTLTLKEDGSNFDEYWTFKDKYLPNDTPTEEIKIIIGTHVFVLSKDSSIEELDEITKAISKLFN